MTRSDQPVDKKRSSVNVGRTKSTMAGLRHVNHLVAFLAVSTGVPYQTILRATLL